ncbi:hypothetical protein [Nitrospirillum amazonense]|uniref:Dolichyl-phosphate-mannose-protein mannosyltransferase n=1 Tax=Nitrospirillum amazonense TaxID=28077 RepID=A0A560JCN5_9PROT|nr:hypothetical protein [Nitrospirillum amazonense]MDG3439921.1 hypothetical protein [Nitrospirillum amazonense]TWB68737.1 hypothetical protein FBZ87_11046 [Nitrospirillum amazonense]
MIDADWFSNVTFLVYFTFVILALTYLPWVAAVTGGGRWLKLPAERIVLGGVSYGVAGYVTFFAYFFSRAIGTTVTLIGATGFVAAAVCAWRAGWLRRERLTNDPALTALVLVGLFTLALSAAGLIYGGMGDVLRTAAVRFSHHLPIDNALPRLFEDGLYHNYIPRPLTGDWLTSDRPPLQTGLALEVAPLAVQAGWRHDMAYELASIGAQAFFLLGLAAYLAVWRLKDGAIAVGLVACAFSSVAIINGFFVWPKLIAAGFILMTAALLLSPYYHEIRASWRHGALVGATAALAMLSHGSTAFILLAVVVLFLAMGRIPTWRFILAGGVCFIALMLPWSLYQALVDPPGNRLLKYHLADVTQVDPRSTWETLRDVYGPLSWQQILHTKWINFQKIFDGMWDIPKWIGEAGGALLAGDSARYHSLSGGLRGGQFFLVSSVVSVFYLGLPAVLLAVRHQKDAARFVLVTGGVFLLTAVVWSLAMFKEGATIIHQGALAMPLMAIAAGAVGLYALSPWLAIIVTGAEIMVSVAIFGIGVPDDFLKEYHEPLINPGMAVVAALGTIGFILACRRLGRQLGT